MMHISTTIGETHTYFLLDMCSGRESNYFNNRRYLSSINSVMLLANKNVKVHHKLDKPNHRTNLHPGEACLEVHPNTHINLNIA